MRTPRVSLFTNGSNRPWGLRVSRDPLGSQSLGLVCVWITNTRQGGHAAAGVRVQHRDVVLPAGVHPPRRRLPPPPLRAQHPPQLQLLGQVSHSRHDAQAPSPRAMGVPPERQRRFIGPSLSYPSQALVPPPSLQPQSCPQVTKCPPPCADTPPASSCPPRRGRRGVPASPRTTRTPRTPTAPRPRASAPLVPTAPPLASASTPRALPPTPTAASSSPATPAPPPARHSPHHHHPHQCRRRSYCHCRWLITGGAAAGVWVKRPQGRGGSGPGAGGARRLAPRGRASTDDDRRPGGIARRRGRRTGQGGRRRR
jgi:hypothetical protein